MNFLNFVTDDDMEIPATTKKQTFREIFCGNEVPREDYLKLCCGTDSLLLVPGKQVAGKGLRNELKQCIITIRKKDVLFIYHNGDKIEGDGLAQPLDDNCILIFLGNAEEAFVLLLDEDGSERQLFRFDDDVEIGVFLQTELYNGRNGYYLCLLKDAACGMNLCSVTADSQKAEFMLRLFICQCEEV